MDPKCLGNGSFTELSGVRGKLRPEGRRLEDSTGPESVTGYPALGFAARELQLYETAMPLDTYRRKRDFKGTPEPKGARRAYARGLSFVIQKHAALRLHYDFRLELDGVLKSWAVPKGPSLDPHDRRLAVQVEDHPLEYATFEGIIPKGQYGAGKVELWDAGTWIPEGNPRRDLARGKLSFTLEGKKLRGSWTLVRMGGRASRDGHDNWLLIKERELSREASGPDLRRRRKA